MVKPKRPHQPLTLKTKLHILEAVSEKKKKKSEIASEFGIPRSTLSTIIKNRMKILEIHNADFFNSSRKRARVAAWPELEKALLLWLKKARNQNFPVSGPLIKEKAENLALQLGVDDFKGSDGWLTRFRDRHALVFRSVCGEAGDVSTVDTESWKKDRLPNIIKGYSADDIYNADETGLFWKQLPNKTLTFKGDTCSGGKMSKVRITVLACSNMSGTDKVKLLVIGKSQKPRCFKGVKTLPADYEANSKAWVTSEIFKRWLYKLDRSFKAKNRKVLLFLDNCSAHPSIDDLTSITLCFFPPNTTAVLQPMDQGILQNLKFHYRKHLMHRILLCLEHEKEYEIDILKAIHLIVYSWNTISPKTIQNCFEHAGFTSSIPVEENATSAFDEEPDNSGEIFVDIPTDFSFNEFVNVDENVKTCSNLSDEAIIEEIRAQRDTHEVSGDEDEANSAVNKELTNQEVISAIETDKHFLTMQENTLSELKFLNNVEKLAMKAWLKKRKQMEIVDYFKKV